MLQLKTMRQEDYQKVVTDLELHYQDFMRNSQGSNMFGDDEKRKMQSHFSEAQNHYQKLVVQLPGQTRETTTVITKKPPPNTTSMYRSYG